MSALVRELERRGLTFASMPQGVEHPGARRLRPGVGKLTFASMPQGVEHEPMLETGLTEDDA